jgi:hypothetical protein
MSPADMQLTQLITYVQKVGQINPLSHRRLEDIINWVTV